MDETPLTLETLVQRSDDYRGPWTARSATRQPRLHILDSPGTLLARRGDTAGSARRRGWWRRAGACGPKGEGCKPGPRATVKVPLHKDHPRRGVRVPPGPSAAVAVRRPILRVFCQLRCTEHTFVYMGCWPLLCEYTLRAARVLSHLRFGALLLLPQAVESSSGTSGVCGKIETYEAVCDHRFDAGTSALQNPHAQPISCECVRLSCVVNASSRCDASQ